MSCYALSYRCSARPLCSAMLTGSLVARQASWIGRPFTLPSFAVDTQRENRAYASWNGATEVTHWRLLGGSRPKLLNSLERTRKLGFETELCVEGRNDYFAVAAYDAKVRLLTLHSSLAPRKADFGLSAQGKCLGVSETHHWSNGTSTGVAMKCSGVLLVDHTSLFLCLGLSVRPDFPLNARRADLMPSPALTAGDGDLLDDTHSHSHADRPSHATR